LTIALARGDRRHVSGVRAAGAACAVVHGGRPISRRTKTFTGVPWTGAPGITETVAEIMRREALAARVDTSVPQERRPEQAEGHGPKSDNASASAVASWPAGAASRSVAPSNRIHADHQLARHATQRVWRSTAGQQRRGRADAGDGHLERALQAVIASLERCRDSTWTT